MNELAPRKWTTLLFSPSVYLAGRAALGFGIGLILLTSLVAAAGRTHFDGVLDTHSGARGTLLLFVTEGFVDWLCLALCLVIAGKIVSRTAFRAIDVFGTQAVARAPSLGIALLTLPPAFRTYTAELVAQLTSHPQSLPPLDADAVYFFTATILMLGLLVWMIALMFNAYRVACNIRGARAVVSFIIGLLVAEVLSKCAIAALIP